MGPTEKIRTLERRMAYLEPLIDDSNRTDQSYIRAEYAALCWAIPLLCEATAVHQVVRCMRLFR